MITQTFDLSGNRLLHFYRGRVSNCYIVEDRIRNVSYLVDCGMPSDGAALSKILENFPPLQQVVCTHFHVDHISGWISLSARFPDARILFHEAACPLVAGRTRIPWPTPRDFRSILWPCMKAYGYVPDLSDVTSGGLYGTPLKSGFPDEKVGFFSENDTPLPGFITLHTPGHRPDCTSFLNPDSGILISGDFLLVIQEKVVSNTFVENAAAQQRSLDYVRQLNSVSFVCPGHGTPRSINLQTL